MGPKMNEGEAGQEQSEHEALVTDVFENGRVNDPDIPGFELSTAVREIVDDPEKVDSAYERASLYLVEDDSSIEERATKRRLIAVSLLAASASALAATYLLRKTRKSD